VTTLLAGGHRPDGTIWEYSSTQERRASSTAVPNILGLLSIGSVMLLSLPTMVSTDRLDNCRGIREDWKQEHMLISFCCINKFYDIHSVQ
jgi:hypothetical protein